MRMLAVGNAELPPQLLAADYAAVDHVGAAEQSGRIFHAAFGQRRAHCGTGNALAIPG